MVDSISIIYILFMALFMLVFFVNWFRLIDRIWVYFQYGFYAGFITFTINFVLYLLTLLSTNPFLQIFGMFTVVLVFFKMYMITMQGMYYSHYLGIISFPLSIQWFESSSRIVALFEDEASEIVYEEENDSDKTQPAISENEEYTQLDSKEEDKTLFVINLDRYTTLTVMGSGVLCGLFGMIYSVLLFFITQPTISENVKKFADVDITQAQSPYFVTALLIGLAGKAFCNL
jgi:hypothetical protein